MMYDDFINLIHCIEYTDENELKTMFTPENFEQLCSVFTYLANKGAYYIDDFYPQLQQNTTPTLKNYYDIKFLIQNNKKELVIGAAVATAEIVHDPECDIDNKVVERKISNNVILFPCAEVPTLTEFSLEQNPSLRKLRKFFFNQTILFQ
jgi:hypothetical protein